MQRSLRVLSEGYLEDFQFYPLQQLRVQQVGSYNCYKQKGIVPYGGPA